jgi:hypothetical protein
MFKREHHTCPLRVGVEDILVDHDAKDEDRWKLFSGRCSFCGSMKGSRALGLIEQGYNVKSSTPKQGVIEDPKGKFMGNLMYTHLSELERITFLVWARNGRMVIDGKRGGLFLARPYFMEK